jgi:hypothetical protein
MKARGGFLQDEFDELDEGGDDEDESDGLQVFSMERNKNEFLKGPSDGGSAGDDENDGAAHAASGGQVFGDAEERANA